ncbi:MAG: alanine--tRNA ligase [Planctomycetota bacterium]
MKTDELRQKYLDFFEGKGHTVCPSDVMVPKWDKSVLFTPAGMNQFKDHFLGKVDLEFTKATTSQKCLRTGDIENVGRTAYHHTFFEMLGNFSFGDYFKKEAIHWAWEFLTDKKWLAFDPNRLTVSVYLDDDEAADIWHQEIGLSLDRIARLDEKENFWPASSPSKGPDGVCGPCSEIFFHPDDGPECEIWNLVFTQFNRVGNPPDNLVPLPSRNIDTGMGLERTSAVLQNCSTNFHIDTLYPIVQAAAEVCGVKYEEKTDNGRRIRRITDHVRACSLAIHENVYPGTKKEESVIRLLLRRAVLQGYEIGLRDPFLFQLVPDVVDQLSSAYPELTTTVERVQSVIKLEEEGFYGLIDQNISRIDSIIQDAVKNGSTKLNAEQVALAYQTHGVPPEIAESVAEKNGLAFDWEAFEAAMSVHGEASGKGKKTVMGDAGPLDLIKRDVKSTRFLGYEKHQCETIVKGLIEDFEGDESSVDSLTTSEVNKQCVVVQETPFYAESGGQVGDQGILTNDDGEFEVWDTQKTGDVFYLIGKTIKGKISVGSSVKCSVNTARRGGIERAHSATHILHYALQQNLGSHAQQRGSKVSDDELRFDFANMESVDPEVLDRIEKQTNEKIQHSESVVAKTIPLDEAKKLGAMMLFGEKYPDPVRMVSIGDYSRELCGGTHVGNSGDVRRFEILSETPSSAGTRRIQAITGEKAEQYQQQITQSAVSICTDLGVDVDEIGAKVEELSSTIKSAKKQIESGQSKPIEFKIGSVTGVSSVDYLPARDALRKASRLLNIAISGVPDRIRAMLAEWEQLSKDLEKLKSVTSIDLDELLASAESKGDVKVVVREIPGINAGMMRKIIDQLRKKSDSFAALLLTSPSPDKVIIAAGISRHLVDQGVHAGKWIGKVAQIVGGKGGGRPDFAQAGGNSPDKIKEAVDEAVDIIRALIPASG